MIKQYNIICPY